MNSSTMKDGILQGVVITPFSGQSIDIRFVGSFRELVMVARFLGLEPSPDQIAAPREGENDDALILLHDQHGGHATLQPVDRASDLLRTIAFGGKPGGEMPPINRN